MSPTPRLDNGVEMPAIGSGVFHTPPEQTTAAVSGIAKNFDFDFNLTQTERAAIDGPDRGVRGGPEPPVVALEAFSRHIEEA